MDRREFEEIARFCQEHHSEYVSKVLSVADDVCKDYFLFDMPWDLERTSEPTQYSGKIDWYLIKNGDREYLYQMNRHRYFIILGQAYRLTGDERYVEKIISLLNDWVDNVPCEKGNGPWRSLETGLRGEFWTRAFDLIEGSPKVNDEFVAKYRASLDEHGRLLADKFGSYFSKSNWGVIQDHGLFAIGVALDNKDYINLALERMYKEADMQIMSDGVQWEQSSTYHNEVLCCFIDAIIRARKANIALDNRFVDKVHAMARVNMAWMKPNGYQPLVGDSDYIPLNDILTECALIFDDSELRYVGGDVLDFESAWLFGVNGIEKYASMAKSEPSFTSISLGDSGNHIMRTSFDSDANYLIFRNGYTGGGHAHEDKLSFELSIGGRDIIMDSGRGTYVWANARKHLKSFRAHNVVAIDNRHFVKSVGWDYTHLAPSVKQTLDIRADYEFIMGTHLGYAKGLFGVVPTRKILHIKPDIYVIIDEFRGAGYHSYSSYLNFANDGDLTVDASGATFNCDDVSVKVAFVNKNVKVNSETGLFSEYYNKIENNRIVKSTHKAFGNNMALTVIARDLGDLSIERVPVTLEDGREVSDRIAMAVRIRYNGKKYVVINIMNERAGVLFADAKPATGGTTYYEEDIHHSVDW